MLREAAPETDAQLNMTGLVHHAFNQYEDMVRVAEEQAGAHREEEEDVTLPPSPEHTEPVEAAAVPINGVDHDRERMPNNDEDNHMADAERILEESSNTPLFAGSRLSSLSATIILLQSCRTHKCTSAFVTELFTILKNSVLPEINTIPPSEYAATKLLRKLGLEHVDIDVCPNGCMLYRGEDEEKDMCTKPTCRAARFRRVGTRRVAQKVLRFFPLIPHLQRIYSTPKRAALQTWHHANRSIDGKMRHAADSKQWDFVNSLDESFTSEH